MNDTEYYSFGDRLYETPTTSRDEQMSFADNLRAAQQAANAQIKAQTENLGTQVPSVKGGLTGPEGYFQSRYQSAPTNALVSDLRAAAQADALNKVLTNYSSQMQKQYNDAYRQYQKNQARRAAAARNYGTGGTTGVTGGTGGGWGNDGDIETIASDANDLSQVTIDENGVVVPAREESSASAMANIVNNMAANQMSGGGQLPTQVGQPIYLEQDGLRTGARLYNTRYGVQGLETPTQSYTGSGASDYLNNFKSSGGRIYNSAGKDITDIWRLIY